MGPGGEATAEADGSVGETEEPASENAQPASEAEEADADENLEAADGDMIL